MTKAEVVRTVHAVWELEDRALAGDADAVRRMVNHARQLRAAAWGLLEQRGMIGKYGRTNVHPEAVATFERELLDACAAASDGGAVLDKRHVCGAHGEASTEPARASGGAR